MRRIALVLLVVAARAQDQNKLVGSVEFDDGRSRIPGMISFSQENSNSIGVDVHCHIWGVPDGNYTAVVHNLGPFRAGHIPTSVGPARAKRNSEGLEIDHQPLTIFERVWIGRGHENFRTFAKGVSLIGDDNNSIADSMIALYAETPSGLKLCGKSPKKVASPVTWGIMESRKLTIPEPRR